MCISIELVGSGCSIYEGNAAVAVITEVVDITDSYAIDSNLQVDSGN